MKKKKKGNRLFAVILAAAMLFSSMTAYADADAPVKSETPQYQDIHAIKDYVGKKVYETEIDRWLPTENVLGEVPYYEEGMRLASSSLEEAYCKFVEGDGAFTEEKINGLYEDDLPDDDMKETYENFYKTAMALAGSVQIADGTKYVDDIIDEYYDFWKDTAASLEAKVDSKVIIRVENEEDAPDTASMKKGTYWVLESDMVTYWSALEEARAIATEERWRWENGKFTSTRAEVLECIKIVTDAYNTLLDKLHEGTAETAVAEEFSKPEEPLKKISSEPATSYKDEASEPPVLVNEVVYAGGGKKQSTMEGVYCKTFTAGTIYTDEPQKIMQAAGLSEKEIADGVVVKYFICTSRNKEMNKMLTGTVSEQGYKVLGIMNNDLYKLAKGTITKIKTTGEEISVVLGIPENLRSDQYEFIVMCYDENGALVVMPDLDGDKATITVQSKNFGYWAVGYRVRQ